MAVKDASRATPTIGIFVGALREAGTAGAAREVALGRAVGVAAALEVEEVPGRGRGDPARPRDQIDSDGDTSTDGRVVGAQERRGWP